MGSDRTRLARAAVLVALVVLLGGCGSGGGDDDPDRTETTVVDTSGAVPKSGTGERRTDLVPLTKRFAGLGEPASATWMSGTLGDDDVPGPSSYWIDAVVTLGPGEATALAERHATTPTDAAPEVVDALRDDVPSGTLTTSDALDRALGSPGWTVEAYLSADTDRVVLVARGQ